MIPEPQHPDADKLLTTIPDGPKRKAAKRLLALYERETQWHGFASLSWLGLAKVDWHGQYGPAVQVYGLHIAHAVEVRAKSMGVPCVVVACGCPNNCDKWYVLPALLHREPKAGQQPQPESGDASDQT